MTPEEEFQREVRENIQALGRDDGMRALTRDWFVRSFGHRYSYNFRWMGLPIIQYPQDIVAMQELLWQIQPELVIETGVARGGSLVFYASMLELQGGAGRVLGIDIDIRAHNRAAIEAHPMARRIDLIQGSSIDESIVAQARAAAQGKRTLVVLDSNHTHDHVLAELRAYAPLASVDSYCVVMDTVVEDMPAGYFQDRPWDVGDNPKTAVQAYLREDPRFEVDHAIDAKLQISVAPDGYLRRLR